MGVKKITSNNLITPRIFDTEFASIFDHTDNSMIKKVEDDTKLEIHLDTSGYRPGELKVEAGEGVVTVEGKHEEKTESGEVMVSRQFYRQFIMPQGAKEQEVVSSLSKDGVLVITLPKQSKNIKHQETRNVYIATQ